MGKYEDEGWGVGNVGVGGNIFRLEKGGFVCKRYRFSRGVAPDVREFEESD